MKLKLAALAVAASLSLAAHAVTEVQWWHSMTAVNGEWVNDLAKGFNASQSNYKIVPTYKGTYDESMTSAVAAFRAGHAPHILQVFEVGTATMMASKNAIVPVGKVMKDAGQKFDPKAYISAVGGYYTAPSGEMLSMPFNSSTTVFYINKDAFKAARAGQQQSSHQLARGRPGCGQAQGQWPQVPADHRLAGLDPAGKLFGLAQRGICHQKQWPGWHGRPHEGQLPAACAPH